MSQRRSSTTQMAQINESLTAQNKQIREIHRVAEQANQTTINVQGELGRQRGVIQNNIDKNTEIKYEIVKADKKTNQMRRRELCIKGMLWLLAILLFATNIGLIIWKANGMNT